MFKLASRPKIDEAVHRLQRHLDREGIPASVGSRFHAGEHSLVVGTAEPDRVPARFEGYPVWVRMY